MLSRRIAARASPLRSATAAVAARRLPIVQQRTFLPEYNKNLDERYPAYPNLSDAEDPNMNGGYVQPAPIKRQFRDPHADWWDKQERRNYGEPCHEDYDQLGIFSPHEYTWVSPRKGLVQIAAFIATFLSVCYVIKATYPDRPSFPREFEGGLERELGGAGATRASSPTSQADGSFITFQSHHSSRLTCGTPQARAPEDPEPFQVEELD